MKLVHQIGVIILIAALSPLFLLFGLSIVATSGLPILYRQRRTGKDGKPFYMYKFRTMGKGADQMQKGLRQRNEASGPAFKIRNDPRFTPFGKFLSHTGLDELPQLWNVIKGDMALFGPRPLPVAEAKKLKLWHRERYSIKPGIISPWVFEGYHQRSFDEWMQSDIDYAKQKSLSTDCILFGKSIVFVAHLIVQEFEDRVFHRP